MFILNDSFSKSHNMHSLFDCKGVYDIPIFNYKNYLIYTYSYMWLLDKLIKDVLNTKYEVIII